MSYLHTYIKEINERKSTRQATTLDNSGIDVMTLGAFGYHNAVYLAQKLEGCMLMDGSAVF